uniref:Homeobox domain-containing protein n=1 Tax=Panagrolaimus sp. PS1159 TaxID=55785 RepID=A0AC35GRC7_9BILA
MTFYDGSHDYHPCEYDFDVLWSQFEEQKENDTITSCSSVEICQPLIPQPSRQELSLAVPQPPQISQSSTDVASSSSSKVPLSPSHQQQLNSPGKTQKQEPVLWSQFEGQRNDNEHAETTRSTAELPPPPPHFLHHQHTQHHHLPLAPWPTLPHPQPSALPQFLTMEKYSSSPEMAHRLQQQFSQSFLHRPHGLQPLVSWAAVPQPSILSQSSTLAEYSLSSEVPRVRPHQNSSQQQPPRRRVKRKAPKQEPLDENVALPSGFDRVLENAAINYNNIIDAREWEPPRRRDFLPPLRKRRKRTSLDASQRLALDSYFDVNQRPDNAQMADIAKTLDLEFEVVHVWFCNRRQKTRKSMPKMKNEIYSDTSASPIN